jgi:hypothetical protein
MILQPQDIRQEPNRNKTVPHLRDGVIPQMQLRPANSLYSPALAVAAGDENPTAVC